MARTKISEFSPTPGNNTDIDGINIAEGCPPSSINNAIRELMSQLKDFQAGTAGDSFNGPIGTTTAAAGSFTTLTTSGAVTHNAGAANGVAYLNGSKVLTTGSALTYNGSAMQINAASFPALKFGDSGATLKGEIYYGIGGNDLNIVNYVNGPIAFQTNGSEQMRLTSTGLGIGTSSPSVRLHVANSGGDNVSYFERVGGSRVILYNASGDSYFGTTTNTPLRFATNDVERARIDSSGNLLVGTTSAQYKITASNSSSGAVFAQTTAGFGQFAVAVHNTANNGDNSFIIFGTEASFTSRGSITFNRTAGLTAYNTTSDYRAKDIIGLVTDSGALIDSVPVYIGKMKGATQERPMFIAHEVPAYAHTGEKDAVDADGKPVYQQMDASALVPVMWAELQSLRARVAQLESN